MAIYRSGANPQFKKNNLGALESNMPNLYEEPVIEKTIIKADAKKYIPSIIESISTIKIPNEKYAENERLFHIVLCGAKSTQPYQESITELCERVDEFSLYLLYLDRFYDVNLPMIQRLVKPVREQLDMKLSQMRIELENLPKSKFCMQTHDVLYYSLPFGARPSLSFQYSVIE